MLSDYDKRNAFDMEKYMKRKKPVVAKDEVLTTKIDLPEEAHLSAENKIQITNRRKFNYAVFSEAVNVLQTLVIALGAGLAVWGVVNL